MKVVDTKFSTFRGHCHVTWVLEDGTEVQGSGKTRESAERQCQRKIQAEGKPKPTMPKFSDKLQPAIVDWLRKTCDIVPADIDRSVVVDLVAADIELEVQNLMADGTIPKDTNTFEDLHRYVDANCLGGLDEIDFETTELEEFTVFCNEVIERVHEWLQQRCRKS